MPVSQFNLNITDASLIPVYRRLRGYSFDPSFANRLDAFGINTIAYSVRWEPGLQPGPMGEYLEVIDVDPASGVFYPPVDLSDPQFMAQDGLPPSESNPQFHQQMVYAVAMTTIQNFEKALGRPVQWASINYDTKTGKNEEFVPRLRLYPHAIRDANAYYSPDKKAVLFGYFSARPNSENILMPGSLVFTCLSHDIICHEVTHALIDGIYKGYVFPLHTDTLALHEAFSDLVALFQHFTFPEVLENQIARTRGNLKGQHLLSELAQQFGLAVGNYSSLRDAIGCLNEKGEWEPTRPDPKRLRTEHEPHARGSILVAAIFDAFLNIYQKRTADLYRIATEGTGVLPSGEIQLDLVKRLAYEATRTARQFLSLCIRALDYCPPIGTTFGEFLRALITADVDLVPSDPLGYRVALIESFKRWGIYPERIRTLSVENLSYYAYTEADILAIIEEKREEEHHQLSPEYYFIEKLNDLKMKAEDLAKDLTTAIDDFVGNNEEKFEKKKLIQVKEKLTPIVESLNAIKEISGSLINKEKVSNMILLEFKYLMGHYYNETARYLNDREQLFLIGQKYKRQIHELFANTSKEVKTSLQTLTGILLDENEYTNFVGSSCKDELNKLLKELDPIAKENSDGNNKLSLIVDDIYQLRIKLDDKAKISFRIDTLHRAQRVGPDTKVLNQVVLTIMQQFQVKLKLKDGQSERALSEYTFSGGCTLVVDIDKKTIRIISKGVIDTSKRRLSLDVRRLAYELIRRYRPNISETASPFAPSRWPSNEQENQEVPKTFEPFGLLHQNDL